MRVSERRLVNMRPHHAHPIAASDVPDKIPSWLLRRRLGRPERAQLALTHPSKPWMTSVARARADGLGIPIDHKAWARFFDSARRSPHHTSHSPLGCFITFTHPKSVRIFTG